VSSDPEDFSLGDYIPFLLNRAGTVIASSFTAVLKEYGVNIVTWRLLAALHHKDGQRIGELAKFTGIEIWTVSRLAKKLEDEGLVHRDRSGSDARSVSVYLSKTGMELTEELIEHAREHETVPLDGFSQEERRQLQTLLERIYTNMDDLEMLAATPRMAGGKGSRGDRDDEPA
jgi:DNA-binding MarR family transcriptional regulator